MTYPLIGNYGVNAADVESRSLWLEGFVVKELSRSPSNWRAEKDLDSYLRQYGVPGIEGMDTRGTDQAPADAGRHEGRPAQPKTWTRTAWSKRRKASPGLTGRDLVQSVTCDKAWRAGERTAQRRQADR